MGKTIDFKAMEKWNKIPKASQQLILKNVLCRNCDVTTIVDYTMTHDKFGVVLRGKCKKCGATVARVLEED